MKKGYFLKVIFTVFLYFIIIQATVIPVYSCFEYISNNRPTTKADPPIYEYSDSINLDYEYLIPITPYPNYDAPYGFTYSFSTSPNCDITVFAMTSSDYQAWRSHELHDKKTLEQDKTSGSGKYRFNNETQWVIVFWNTDSDYTSTMITFTVTIEKVPPIGMIIGFSAGGVVVIAIIVGAVVGFKRKPDNNLSSDSCISDYEQIPAISAPSAKDQALFDIANSEFQNGKTKEAIKLWLQLLDNSPEFYPAMCNLAMAHTSLGNTSKAIEYLNQALAIKPDYKPALDLLEIAKSKLGNVTSADNDSFA